MTPLNFKHINAEEQIFDGSITSSLFAVGAVTVQAMNINGNLTFNAYQALDFRVENVSVTPAPGNVGRVVYNTTTNQFLIDNGIAFVPVSGGGGGVSSLNSLTGALTLAAGSNITITPSGGNTLTIASTGGGSGITQLTGDVTAGPGSGSEVATLATVNSDVGSFTNVNITVNAKGLITAASSGVSPSANYQKDLFTVTIPSDLEFDLSYAPILNSEIVSWNGVVLRPGVSNDYIIVTVPAPQLQLSGAIVLNVNDTIMVSYAR